MYSTSDDSSSAASPSNKLQFTATSGDRVVLPCPIQPGALLRHYSVRWMKDNTAIALFNPQRVRNVINDSRYEIDRTDYSLIIKSVNINDTSIAGYRCDLTVHRPTLSQYVLQSTPSVTLSLKVNNIGRQVMLICNKFGSLYSLLIPSMHAHHMTCMYDDCIKALHTVNETFPFPNLQRMKLCPLIIQLIPHLVMLFILYVHVPVL